MHAVMNTDNGIRAVDVDDPDGAGVRLSVVSAGICGTDVTFAAAAAKYQGLDVDVATRHANQIVAAERLGFGRPDGAYDVVLDAAGSDSSLARAAEAARPGGRIVSLGVYTTTMPIPGVLSLIKELSYINSIAYGRHDAVREVEEVASMLAKKPEIARTIITHRYPIEDAHEAFRVAAGRQAGAIKVVIEP